MAAGYEDCCIPCLLDQPVQKLCLDVSAPGCEFDGAHVELCPTTAQLCERPEWAGNNRPPGPIGGEDCYVDAVVGCGIGEGVADGTWGIAWAVGAFAFTEDPVSVSVTCDPLQIVFDYGTISAPGSCCSETTTTVTVTVTACDFDNPWCGEASERVWNPTTGECELASPPPPPGPTPLASRRLSAPAPPRTGRTVTPKRPPPARPNRCEHLGRREERKAGCNGFRCSHACTHPADDPGHAAVVAHLGGKLPLTTVPAGPCQTCPGYEDSGRGWG